jgi:hypothetical protein
MSVLGSPASAEMRPEERFRGTARMLGRLSEQEEHQE